MKTEILYGIHPVLEAIRAARRDFIEICMAKSSPRLEKLAADAESHHIPVKRISISRLKEMTGTEQHQGVAARVSPYPFADLSDIFEKADSAGPRFLLIPDTVSDTNNLGALIRTALCAGVHGMILLKDRSALPTPAVSKASAGAMEHILVTRVTNLVSAIKELKKNGLWVIGTDKAAEQPLFETDLTCPLAFVIGGEEKGIRPLVRQHCDLLIRIPQTGQIDSLNASAAGAVVMYEAFRQREMMK
ncbi:MAG: 23S rRNA (guanosine(2251)-2'-O)-methyltransferase RlmB [Desulfobacteraceae bacterium IS3]|nr:MAG: 23S rRNA (guanosine(2251)-2'-O)-methyltransferase RlmB [Desulfobacteraceae bacterium IS3]